MRIKPYSIDPKRNQAAFPNESIQVSRGVFSGSPYRPVEGDPSPRVLRGEESGFGLGPWKP
jgi:hypothetical protein